MNNSRRLCDACGKPQASISMGSALLCRECDPEVRAEMDRLRAEGQPVNALHIARRRYKEEFSGGNYLLRDYPEDLWNRLKHRAVDDGTSVREIILRAIEAYITQ